MRNIIVLVTLVFVVAVATTAFCADSFMQKAIENPSYLNLKAATDADLKAELDRRAQVEKARIEKLENQIINTDRLKTKTVEVSGVVVDKTKDAALYTADKVKGGAGTAYDWVKGKISK